MNSVAIRNELRHGTSDDLQRRRKIITLSSVGLVDFSVITLYQTGVLKKLPDIPLRIFDSNRVNASREAYMMGAPDGPISATGYAMAMVLSSVGGSDNTDRHPVWDLLLGGVVAGNALGGAYYLYDMAAHKKKICMYCIAGAAINFASAVIAAPLVRNAWKRIFS